jgi:Holliday junction DNA helicase RuvA
LAKGSGDLLISKLTGTIITMTEQTLTLEIQGVGFELFVPDVTKFQVAQTVSLFSHLHWNTEQGPSLFGFASLQEKTIFLLITRCPGIGPKLALAILQHCPINTFLSAITQGNVACLTDIPGIGRKKAEQLILELKDKVSTLMDSGFTISNELSHWKELTQALDSLNYSKYEITQTMDYLRSQEMPQATFDQLLRKSLSYLAKRK